MSKTNQNGVDNEIVYAGRLLKSALMEFPEGSYLLSNVYESDGQPVIEGRIPSLEKRARVWRKIKDCRANGRLCRVFKTNEGFFAYKEKLERELRHREFLNAMQESLAHFSPYQPPPTAEN